jgi:ribonuclease G
MKKILITVRPWEKRIAILKDSRLASIFFDSRSSSRLEGCFFKGTVTKVLPGVQSAFVDIGQEKAGFLHVSEIDRDLSFKNITNCEDEIDEDSNQFQFKNGIKNIDIANILKENESILVQASKEPINDKGAKLTTCFSLPGRFVVLMPNITKIGISKKIVDFAERKRLKDIVVSMLPEYAGCIIRTTCEGRDEGEIAKDINYLIDVWNGIQKNYETAKSGECVYRDIDLVSQVIRDHLDNFVESIICDDYDTRSDISDFLKKIAPDSLYKLFGYNEPIPLFEQYDVELQVTKSLNSKVYLESGGSIIIDSVEAMTVIDVNTARYVGSTRLEETILKTNMEAAKEIVRQLKLRNIGGLVVIDFIDMFLAVNKNKLFSFFEKTLREEDKSQSVVLKISEFGLVQMTRKRTGKTLRQELTENCANCAGEGVIKSLPARAYEAFRFLEKFLSANLGGDVSGCYIIVDESLAYYIVNSEYDSFLSLEKKYKIQFIVKSSDSIGNNYSFELFI